jgi:hypothetical protein
LKIFIPRFVQGDGSVIDVNLHVDSRAKISAGQYVVYTTFDQGSVKKILPVNEIGDMARAEPFKFTDSIVSTIAAGVTAIAGLLLSTYVNRKRLWRKPNPKKKTSA